MATSGPNYGATAADDASVGVRTWSNTGNVFASDDSYASVTNIQSATSHYLKVTNFGFSIPTDATIDGILVEWERREPSGVTVDNSVKIVKGGTITGTDKSVGAAWPSTDAFNSYGGSSDLWGTTWTASDINSSDFGCVISCVRSGAESVQTAFVDSVRITVYYTEASTDTNDERAAKVVGAISTTSERDAKVAGQSSDVSERDAKTTGSEAAVSSRDAKVVGVGAINLETPVQSGLNIDLTWQYPA